ncbi:hypothetical protein N665_1881s0008 [Sinapis alba]|nr:hypothetical protein N665_1881s0008 [Sinapis alba]
MVTLKSDQSINQSLLNHLKAASLLLSGSNNRRLLEVEEEAVMYHKTRKAQLLTQSPFDNYILYRNEGRSIGNDWTQSPFLNSLFFFLYLPFMYLVKLCKKACFTSTTFEFFVLFFVSLPFMYHISLL